VSVIYKKSQATYLQKAGQGFQKFILKKSTAFIKSELKLHCAEFTTLKGVTYKTGFIH
jgi:hypothetical protein